MNDAQKAVRNLSEAMDRAGEWYSEVEAEVDAMTGETDALKDLLKRALDAADRLDSGHRNVDGVEVWKAHVELSRIRDPSWVTTARKDTRDAEIARLKERIATLESLIAMGGPWRVPVGVDPIGSVFSYAAPDARLVP